jgi:hypothetical protein
VLQQRGRLRGRGISFRVSLLKLTSRSYFRWLRGLAASRVQDNGVFPQGGTAIPSGEGKKRRCPSLDLDRRVAAFGGFTFFALGHFCGRAWALRGAAALQSGRINFACGAIDNSRAIMTFPASTVRSHSRVKRNSSLRNEVAEHTSCWALQGCEN